MIQTNDEVTVNKTVNVPKNLITVAHKKMTKSNAAPNFRKRVIIIKKYIVKEHKYRITDDKHHILCWITQILAFQ